MAQAVWAKNAAQHGCCLACRAHWHLRLMLCLAGKSLLIRCWTGLLQQWSSLHYSISLVACTALAARSRSGHTPNTGLAMSSRSRDVLARRPLGRAWPCGHVGRSSAAWSRPRGGARRRAWRPVTARCSCAWRRCGARTRPPPGPPPLPRRRAGAAQMTPLRQARGGILSVYLRRCVGARAPRLNHDCACRRAPAAACTTHMRAGPQVRLSGMCSRTAAARAHSRPALAPAGTRMMRTYGVAGPRVARAAGGAAAHSRAQRRARSHRSPSASCNRWHRRHGTPVRAGACHAVLAHPVRHARCLSRCPPAASGGVDLGGAAVHRGLSEPREAHLLHGLAGRVVRERSPAELSPQPRRAASLRTRCLSPLRRPSQSYLRTCQPATRTAGALPRMMPSGAGAFQPCTPRMPPDQVLREPRTLHCPSLCRRQGRAPSGRARQRCRGCT